MNASRLKSLSVRAYLYTLEVCAVPTSMDAYLLVRVGTLIKNAIESCLEQR